MFSFFIQFLNQEVNSHIEAWKNIYQRFIVTLC